ncbi:MAG: TRAP transporter small permease subunit [Alphaproteobacteria bacterium]|nr:TRAP transporter small permease subunit [Alphaproteobacteria bacterium]
MTERDPIGRLATVLNLRLSWVYAVAVLVTAYEVVMRYGLNSPTIWVHDIAIAVCAVAFVFGGAYAMVTDQHIRITSVYDNLPSRMKRIVDVFNALCTLGFLAGLTYAATIQASRSVALMETSGHAWDVPIPAALKTLLAVGVFLMAVLALDRLLRALFRRRGN